MIVTMISGANDLSKSITYDGTTNGEANLCKTISPTLQEEGQGK